jgi:hypothetical protein
MKTRRTIVLLVAMLTGMTAELQATMIRSVYVFDVPDTMISDRSYFTTHSQEIVRIMGPWLRRYWSFRLFDVPAEADRFNVRRGRMTEAYTTWEEFQEARLDRIGDFTKHPTPEGWGLGKKPGRTGVAMVAAVPTEDFFNRGGREPTLGGVNMDAPRFCRWIMVIKYPEGVSYDEGEKWYVEEHGPELAEKLPGLVHFVSHGLPEELKAVPRVGAAANYSVRVSELWFASYDAWAEALLDPDLELTPPPWAPEATGLEDFYPMITGFVGIWPDVDFLHDRPRIP